MKKVWPIIGLLTGALASAVYVIDRSNEKLKSSQRKLTEVQMSLSIANTQNHALASRLDNLDDTLLQLGDVLAGNQVELQSRLDSINNLALEATDDPKSFECLDFIIPDRLDSELR